MRWPPSISVLLSICMKAFEAAPTLANTSVCTAVSVQLGRYLNLLREYRVPPRCGESLLRGARRACPSGLIAHPEGSIPANQRIV